ncbi:MAG: cysteine--tRNA ligase [Dehalococcoidia bacterium]|nr:MAG: cysteine--tRNA ligase [Dehalococcoidia bacterium]
MRIFNTLSGRIEDFVPQDDTVKMYVCGVTPYAPSHLGHAMSYIVFDTIRRYLEFRGYKVKYVQNFTDIDDKIITRANELNIPATELAERFSAQYLANMDDLNVIRANIYPKATEEIPKIIEVIEGLIQKGHAYESDGDVYFRVTSDPEYGKLSHRNLDDMLAGARIEVSESKEHPLDFALWKAAKPGEPQWQSPWGQGRPGWHIECSAMSIKYLSETIDIHGGGQDLIFPHHENEIAQSESFTLAKPFVRYWLHNGLMQLGEDKMSKSSGRLVTISEALERYSADALRLWVLSSHYRSPITYSDEVLASMDRGVERLSRAAHVDIDDSAKSKMNAQPYRDKFIESMDDDFGTPQAIATLFDLARDINRGHDEGIHIGEAHKTLLELTEILGLTLPGMPVGAELPHQVLNDLANRHGLVPAEEADANSIVRMLIDRRAELRREKEWGRADQIRNDLIDIGITLEDTPQGTVWRHRKP